MPSCGRLVGVYLVVWTGAIGSEGIWPLQDTQVDHSQTKEVTQRKCQERARSSSQMPHPSSAAGERGRGR